MQTIMIEEHYFEGQLYFIAFKNPPADEYISIEFKYFVWSFSINK